MNKKIIIVGMIYKSVSYLKFMIDQIYRNCLTEKIDGYDINYLIVANDANADVLSYLKNNNINHLIYNDPKPNDYYLRRVYRAWNFGAFNADGDILLFVNSDMAFNPGWIGSLLKWLDKDAIPCAFLIESGKMPSMPPAISCSKFGQSCDSFNEKEFNLMANRITRNNPDKFIYGGLFMPSMFYKKEFVESGGFPDGNIYRFINRFTQDITYEPSDTSPQPFKELYMSGDAFFFYKNPIINKRKHITVMDSIAWHAQEGERDEI